MGRIEGLAAVVRGDHVAAGRRHDIREDEGRVVRIGKEIRHELVGDRACGRRPGTRDVARARHVPDSARVREEGAVRGEVVEADAGERERRVGSRDHPRLATVAPGQPVILGDEQAEVGSDEDPVGRADWKMDAELVGKGAVRVHSADGADRDRRKDHGLRAQGPSREEL